MESNLEEEVSAPVTESDQAAETDEVNDTLSEIKEILLENQENSENIVANEPVQVVPTVTEEEFIKFNNSFCHFVICFILCCGIIGGLILGKAFQGIFK